MTSKTGVRAARHHEIQKIIAPKQRSAALSAPSYRRHAENRRFFKASNLDRSRTAKVPAEQLLKDIRQPR